MKSKWSKFSRTVTRDLGRTLTLSTVSSGVASQSSVPTNMWTGSATFEKSNAGGSTLLYNLTTWLTVIARNSTYDQVSLLSVVKLGNGWLVDDLSVVNEVA